MLNLIVNYAILQLFKNLVN